MLASLAAAAVAAAGIWQGTLEREGAPLEVEVVITERNGALEGRFSSGQLRAVGIPLAKVQAADNAVGWQLVGDRTTMVVDANVRGDALTGTFKEASFCRRRVTGPFPESCSCTVRAARAAGVPVISRTSSCGPASRR